MASGAGSTAISRRRCGPLPSRIEEPKLPVAKQITVRLNLGPPLNLTAFARLVLGHAAGVWHSRKKFNRQLEGAACAQHGPNRIALSGAYNDDETGCPTRLRLGRGQVFCYQAPCDRADSRHLLAIRHPPWPPSGLSPVPLLGLFILALIRRKIKLIAADLMAAIDGSSRLQRTRWPTLRFLAV